MKNYFKTEEFIISPLQRKSKEPIPLSVIDKIWTVHVPILNDMRYNLGAPIAISKHSGYRSLAWEIDHGRSGTSEHMFDGLGAVDITADNFQALIDLAIQSEYKRICIYKEDRFIHCDMKGMKRQLFENTDTGWKFIANR